MFPRCPQLVTSSHACCAPDGSAEPAYRLTLGLSRSSLDPRADRPPLTKPSQNMVDSLHQSCWRMLQEAECSPRHLQRPASVTCAQCDAALTRVENRVTIPALSGKYQLGCENRPHRWLLAPRGSLMDPVSDSLGRKMKTMSLQVVLSSLRCEWRFCCRAAHNKHNTTDTIYRWWSRRPPAEERATGAQEELSCSCWLSKLVSSKPG